MIYTIIAEISWEQCIYFSNLYYINMLSYSRRICIIYRGFDKGTLVAATKSASGKLESTLFKHEWNRRKRLTEKSYKSVIYFYDPVSASVHPTLHITRLVPEGVVFRCYTAAQWLFTKQYLRYLHTFVRDKTNTTHSPHHDDDDRGWNRFYFMLNIITYTRSVGEEKHS